MFFFIYHVLIWTDYRFPFIHFRWELPNFDYLIKQIPEQSISHAEALQMQFNQIVIAQAVHLLAFHVEQLRRSHNPKAVVEIGTVRKEMARIIRGTGKEEGRKEE